MCLDKYCALQHIRASGELTERFPHSSNSYVSKKSRRPAVLFTSRLSRLCFRQQMKFWISSFFRANVVIIFLSDSWNSEWMYFWFTYTSHIKPKLNWNNNRLTMAACERWRPVSQSRFIVIVVLELYHCFMLPFCEVEVTKVKLPLI